MAMHKADDVPESFSSNMCRLSDSANMIGNISVSHLYESALTDKVFASYACNGDKEWIIDTGASNHMISHKEMLNFKKPVTAYNKQVYLPNRGTVEDLSSGKVLEIGEEKDGLYLMNKKGIVLITH
ncbi:hypothetical protein KY289_020864 [Solanum tuberosum]|nr:hypothetical protein KY284_020726 [Solanum tuberosum]KAH0683112.1 hypothetical protein KY289_020864 [Solanum tuberosum]